MNKLTLDRFIDKLIYNTAEAVAAKQSGNDKAAKLHQAEIDQARKDIHIVAGGEMSMADRAMLKKKS